MSIPMMKCGHAANAVSDGKPCCAICGPEGEGWNVIDVNAPPLEGRRARCHYYGMTTRHNECNFGGEGDKVCHCEQPSDPERLPFFEYLGPNSPLRLCIHCSLALSAHHSLDLKCPIHYRSFQGREGDLIPGYQRWRGQTFEPKTYEFDSFYCGCHGWD